MEYKDWLQKGLDNRWIGPLVCYTHDGLPISREENDALNKGANICLGVYRSYDNNEHAEQIEDNHSAPLWRKPFNDK